MHKPVNLYLSEKLLEIVKEICQQKERDAGLPVSKKPNLSAVVTCALEDWVRKNGGIVPDED